MLEMYTGFNIFPELFKSINIYQNVYARLDDTICLAPTRELYQTNFTHIDTMPILISEQNLKNKMANMSN